MNLPSETDPQAIVEILASTPGILVPLLGEFPAERLKVRPAPGRWSPHENACHLTSLDDLFGRRLDQLLNEENPMLETYRMDPADQEGALLEADLEQALKRFSETRPQLVERLRGLSPEDWNRAGRHEVFPKMNAFILFRHLALHDMIHTYRIEECLWRKP